MGTLNVPVHAEPIATTASPTPETRTAVELHGRVLWLARRGFVMLCIVALWVTIARIVRVVDEADGLWLAAIGDAEHARNAHEAGGTELALFLAIGGFWIVRMIVHVIAAVLLVRRSNTLIAHLVATFLTCSAASDFPPNLFDLLPTAPLQAIAGLAITYGFALTFVLLFYLFPDGRFTPRWTLMPAVWWAGSLFWTFAITRSLEGNGWLDLHVPLILVSTTVTAQIYRYRHVSEPIERQQTKWFIGGLGAMLAVFIGGNIVLALTGAMDTDASSDEISIAWGLFEALTALASLLIPIGLVVAILRFRLFAIDVIFHRALVYGGLTASIVAVYVLIVGYLGSVFNTGGNLAISLVAAGVVAIIFQPLREHLQRGASRLIYGERDEPYAVLTRLGRRLEATLAPETVMPTIVETVREALKIPYVAIALRQDSELVTVATTGTPTPTLIRLPLIYQQEQVGELLLAQRTPHDPFGPADRQLLDDLARQAGVAAHAVQLTAALQRSRERLVVAREEERRRLRRDLHDGLGPMLGSLTIKLDVARDMIDQTPDSANALLRDLKGNVKTAMVDIRRLVDGLRPPALDELGLVGAIHNVSTQLGEYGVAVDVDAPVDLPPLPAAVEVAVFRIVQEALNNIARHAMAQTCLVRLTTMPTHLNLEIIDDGRGIRMTGGAGIGLTSMRERAEELGGNYTVDSKPDGGTRVFVTVPLLIRESAPGVIGDASTRVSGPSAR